MIEWSETALADFADISAYFADKGEKTIGDKIIEQVYKGTRCLKRSPLSGRLGLYPGTREIVLTKIPYIIIYKVTDKNNTRILRVFHTARLRPEGAPEEQNQQYH